MYKKNSAKKNKNSLGCHGFTLVELMISVALSGLIMATVGSAYVTQRKIATAQEQVTMMQQNLRFAMDIITRDLKIVGYGNDTSNDDDYSKTSDSTCNMDATAGVRLIPEDSREYMIMSPSEIGLNSAC